MKLSDISTAPIPTIGAPQKNPSKMQSDPSFLPITQFIREVMDDSGSEKIVIGLSGGIDSAVCLRLCASALGGRNVVAIHMPSATNHNTDQLLARAEAKACGAQYFVKSIPHIHNTYRDALWWELTKEAGGNLAARIRMCILYAYANKEKALVCGTGNRTEHFLGYTTKWGDNAADFYPILHLWKTQVRELAQELGVSKEIINKPPSAGLWPGQTDEGEIGMTYPQMDKEIQRHLNGGGINGHLYSLHLTNQHKSEPGKSLLETRW